MPRRATAHLNAYRVFEKNLDRARAFIRVFNAAQSARGRGQPTNDEKELLRSAVVFAIGSLDALLHDLVLELVPERGAGPELTAGLKEIAREDPALALRVSLARDHEAAKIEFRKALDGWLSHKSFYGPEAVVRAASYVGCSFDWADVNAARDTIATEKLKHYTDMRHNIVHRGHKPRILRDDADECVALIRDIASVLHNQVRMSMNV